jgi:hypothetical protein
MPTGFGPLQTAADLLAKLRLDLSRIERDPLDAYAAFDFFVTARHVPDWDRSKRPLLDTDPHMKIVRDLAEGAKHFGERRDKAPRPEVKTRRGAFDPNTFQHDAFDVGGLVVAPDPADAGTLGAEISVVDLARAVLAILDTP